MQADLMSHPLAHSTAVALARYDVEFVFPFGSRYPHNERRISFLHRSCRAAPFWQVGSVLRILVGPYAPPGAKSSMPATE